MPSINNTWWYLELRVAGADIEQRQLAYMDKSHDYSTIDPTSIAAISGRHMLQACQAPQAPVSPTKRPQTEESSTPAAKRQRRCASCFRCGRAGHLPVSCSATTTTAGKPVAAFALTPRTVKRSRPKAELSIVSPLQRGVFANLDLPALSSTPVAFAGAHLME